MITETLRLANLTAQYPALVILTAGELAPLSPATCGREMSCHRVDQKSVDHLRTFMFHLNTLRAESVGGDR